jgi:hypothetical protein
VVVVAIDLRNAFSNARLAAARFAAARRRAARLAARVAGETVVVVVRVVIVVLDAAATGLLDDLPAAKAATPNRAIAMTETDVKRMDFLGTLMHRRAEPSALR